MSKLYEKSLKEIRDLLAKRELSATEVVRSCLERIQATNPRLNSMLHVETAAEQALKQAGKMDEEGPRPEQPLWGVPVAVKDCICTKDLLTTCCSRMLSNFVPFYDAYVVERLRRNGAIIIGKTNMDEFAMGSGTETSFFGGTRNPWNEKLIPGGSSGGSAVAVAAGQCYGALGTDTGGSVRQPASMCGCVGVKPTYGRVSRFGAIGFASSLDQVGLFASNVEDGAILLEAIAGLDERDSTCSARPVEPYSQNLPGDLKGVRIGLPKEFWQADGIAPEVLKEAEKAIDAARALGTELVEVDMPHMPLSVASYYIIAPAEANTNLSKFDGARYGFRAEGAETLEELYEQSRTQGFGDEVKRRIMLGAYVLSSGYYDAYYKKASQVRRLIQQDYLSALEKCDALLAPISPVTAWEIGKHSGDPLKSYLMDIFTVSLNLAGLPGIAIPAGLGSDSGMPV
ncbi:MAG: Asp-tRNA(Asn)/Glu-tRNA(Gln) amidotransferase subunit GatA, partial [Desulfovibrionaceae bacterium]|nr:Asp-tRNA(Asn)/Glu-tRNA(Gln) amidotransferase subunit GatA [Desulfovibrionaceae bacterium]